jgi:nicotinate phosphoribosyltransferase
LVDPLDPTRRKAIPADTQYEDLLVPIFRGGRRVYQLPSLDTTRQRAAQQLAALAPGIRRFVNPHRYPVGLEAGLYDRRTQLVLQLRGLARE